MIKLLALMSWAAWIVFAVGTTLGYASLPDVVAVDFRADGTPEMGPKSALLAPVITMLGVSGLTVALMSVFSLKRHTLVTKYPYLINLPAFAILLGKLEESMRRRYVDKVFLIFPAIAIGVLVDMFVVTYFLLESARIGLMVLSGTALTVVVLAIPLVVVASGFLYYYRIYRELKGIAQA